MKHQRSVASLLAVVVTCLVLIVFRTSVTGLPGQAVQAQRLAFTSNLSVTTPSGTLTPTPSAFAYLPYIGEALQVLPSFTPAPSKTPLPIATSTPRPTEPVSAGTVVYEGLTDQNKLIRLTVTDTFSTILRIRLHAVTDCGGRVQDWDYDDTSPEGVAITDRAFDVLGTFYTGHVFEVTGTFASDYSTVSGTWQGIRGMCSGLPGPCWETCRGPVGQWSATRVP